MWLYYEKHLAGAHSPVLGALVRLGIWTNFWRTTALRWLSAAASRARAPEPAPGLPDAREQ
jgi:hypothetical protein